MHDPGPCSCCGAPYVNCCDGEHIVLPIRNTPTSPTTFKIVTHKLTPALPDEFTCILAAQEAIRAHFPTPEHERLK